MSDPEHTSGKALDRCVCVHAEQNALLAAARFGIAVECCTLYTTVSPCFGCLKEAVQAGVRRIVYNYWYPAEYSPALKDQYKALCRHLMQNDETNFEAVGGVEPDLERNGQPDPYADDSAEAIELEPPPHS